MEIENSAVVDGQPDEAVGTLVKALNNAAGSDVWAFVPSSTELPPVTQMDVITNAIIYRKAAVSRVGESRALGTKSSDTGAPADSPFANAREPIAQVFRPAGGGEPFLFVVNHFKSKGSAGPLPGRRRQRRRPGRVQRVPGAPGQGAARLGRRPCCRPAPTRW